MPIVDLIIVAIVVGAGVSGHRRGLAGAPLLIGLAAGALLGSRVSPLIVDGGLRSAYAPTLALVGALLFGVLAANVVDQLAARLGASRRRRRARAPTGLQRAGGALLAACAGLVAVWIVAALLVRVIELTDPLREATILGWLNTAIEPPGPPFGEPARQAERAPSIDDLRRRRATAIKADPEVRAAAGSVVKLSGIACGEGHTGTGWIVRRGIVVTNAHVVAGQDLTLAQVRGLGRPVRATAIWFDPHADLALMRAPALARAPALPMAGRAKSGTQGAIVGFPLARGLAIKPARVGATFPYDGGSALVSRTLRRQVRVRSTRLYGRVVPGNSGSPVVDERGQVLTTVFAGTSGTYAGLGVPVAAVRKALRRAGPRVGTGECR